MVCTLELIKEKYEGYIKGLSRVNVEGRTINAYIICADKLPIGYIQTYNFSDFPRSKITNSLPKNLGTFDILIGEEKYLRKGLGSKAITKFLKLYGTSYSYIIVDPDIDNIAAMKAYEKAGFTKISEEKDTKKI